MFDIHSEIEQAQTPLQAYGSQTTSGSVKNTQPTERSAPVIVINYVDERFEMVVWLKNATRAEKYRLGANGPIDRLHRRQAQMPRNNRNLPG